MNKRVVVGLGLLAIALAGLAIWRGGDDAPTSQAQRRTTARLVDPKVKAKLGQAGRIATSGTPVAPSSDDPSPSLDPAAGMVAISGTVIDAMTREPIGDAEVVMLALAGGAESSTETAADGTYRIEVPAGAYRAFVRGEHVISIGVGARVRIPGLPSPDDVGLPVEDRMPVIAALRSLRGVDLEAVQSGLVRGTVVDGNGAPIAGAVVRAIGRRSRASVGGDVAETDAAGTFELRLPDGGYQLEATHATYAALAESTDVRVVPGDTVSITLTLARGCIIAGRVVLPNGAPAGEGALEEQYAAADTAFAPVGRIAANGTFRYATVAEQEVVLRAWPWKSPPAESQRFACKDGARFENVVFRLPSRSPDLEGILVDHDGKPVPFAHVDLVPLDPGGLGQQERTDATGRWSVYALPAGRYQVSASAPARGVVSEIVSSPAQNVRLALRGTGRLEGTIAQVDTGTVEVEVARCMDDMDIDITRERRVIQVEHGRFSVDDLPACELGMGMRWRTGRMFLRAQIQPGGTTTVALDATRPPPDDPI